MFTLQVSVAVDTLTVEDTPTVEAMDTVVAIHTAVAIMEDIMEVMVLNGRKF